MDGEDARDRALAGHHPLREQTTPHVELLEPKSSIIHVAGFWTKVLAKKLLQCKLHDAVRLTSDRNRLPIDFGAK